MPKTNYNLYGTARASFLASEVGKRLETRDMTAYAATLGVEVTDPITGATVKVIKAGYVYPSNNSSAQGIVYEDVYPTVEGKYIGSLLTAGKVWTNRLSVSIQSAAKTALGFVEFKDHAEVTRPDFGTGELVALATPTITSISSGTASWSTIANNNGYAFFVDGVEVAKAAKGATSLVLPTLTGKKVTMVALGDYVNYKNSLASAEVAYA